MRLSILVGVILLTACCGLSRLSFAGPGSAGHSKKITPLVTTAELVKGSNRFAFGLLQGNKLLEDADVTVRIYRLDHGNGYLLESTKASYQPIRGLRPTPKKIHRHADGTDHVHTSGWGVKGLYTAQLNFPKPGIWGLQLVVKQTAAPPQSVSLSVVVLDQPLTPAVGTPAHRSRNLIDDDVKNLREIDSSPEPDPRMHRMRIADAIDQGKPQLIVFATPQFCVSRMCGPVVDIVRSLLPAYEKRIVFTHQEIWQDFAAKKLFPTVEAWRLETEPWIFVVDAEGIIRAKFEGLVAPEELQQALNAVVSSRS